MSTPRGAAWFFRPGKELARIAAATPVFTDTSLISAFVDGEAHSEPWDAELARAAARAIAEASPDDDRLQDGCEYRFFVGGVSCKGTEAYLKLVATAEMCDAFRTAMKGNPSEHGAAPWVALATACGARNGGLLKGPAVAIVGASRDESYEAAAQCAVKMFECGAHGPAAADLKELLVLCHAAGNRCPLDLKKIDSALAARIVEESAEAARALGAATEDVEMLAAHMSRINVWRPFVNDESDPHVGEESMADVTAMMEAVRTHHASTMISAVKTAERERLDILSHK